MSDAPNISAMSAPQAQAHLDSLVADPVWTKALSSRDPAASKTLKTLSYRINGIEEPVAPADGLVRDQDGGLDLFNARYNLRNHLSPEVTSSEFGLPTMTTEEALEGFESLRRRGFDDVRILERNNPNREYSAEEIAAAKERWAQLESDPEFRRRLDAGEFLARRELSDYATIVTGNVKR